MPQNINELKQLLLDTIDEYDDPEDLIEDPENPFWTDDIQFVSMSQIKKMYEEMVKNGTLKDFLNNQ